MLQYLRKSIFDLKCYDEVGIYSRSVHREGAHGWKALSGRIFAFPFGADFLKNE